MTRHLLFILLCFMLLFAEGCAHTPGDAVLQGGNPEGAAWLYAKGAESGDATAAFKLGQLISQNKISNAKYGTTAKWYLRACELGSIFGCHNVGVAYQEGKDGLSINPQKACDYYLKSAEGGYMPSQYNLAMVYSTPKFQPPNYLEAYKWLLVSRGSARNCRSLPMCDWILQDPENQGTEIKSHLTEDQIREAERLAASWKAKK